MAAETSFSLLERLRSPSDATAWQRLVAVYTPLIEGWLRRHQVAHEDAADLVQDVLAVLLRELPQFQHNQRPGAFRCWLRTITVNRLRAFWKSRQHRPRASGDSDVEEQLAQLEDPNSGLSRLWDQEHDQYVLQRLMRLIEPEFALATWQAFRRLTFDDARAADVARELDMTVNAVLLAKSRVLRRLRQEARGLID
jgi:RNA polymerase sigma-70 factor (ECF subfamily)